MTGPSSKFKTAGLLFFLAFFLLLTVILLTLVGCGNGQATSTEGQEGVDGEKLETEGEVESASYVEGQIKLLLDTDLLWTAGKGDIDPHGEQVQAATRNLYDLAARHGCTVEKYEFLGPFDGAMAIMGLPAGMSEDEAITEFSKEPLVTDAYRFEASE